MDEDGKGVCADSQHENVLMRVELAAWLENQASELPICRPLTGRVSEGMGWGVPYSL